MSDLAREVADSLKSGMRQMSMAEYRAALAQLGYEIDPDSRCACIAKNMTTGNTYPNVNWTPREIDTKRSAFHFESRRDANFKSLQELRFWTFVVQRGAMTGV